MVVYQTALLSPDLGEGLRKESQPLSQSAVLSSPFLPAPAKSWELSHMWGNPNRRDRV